MGISSRVVGTGSIGARYLNALALLTSSRPIAVPIGGVLRDPILDEVATVERLNEPDRPHVDLCVIATNTNRHVEDATSFRGSADLLLIEKPLSFSTQSLRGFDCSRPKAEVAVATPLRFMEGFGAVQATLAAVGEITGVSVECRSWLPSWRPGTDVRRSYSSDPIYGGVLLDLVHEIDYCLRLFGTPVGMNAALSRDSVLGISSESTAHLLWRYGAYDLRMVLDYVSLPPSRRLRVYGTRKSLAWDLLEASVTIWDHDRGTVEVATFPDDLDRDMVLLRQILATAGRSGDARVSSLEQAWQAVAVCDLAKESSRKSGVTLAASAALEVASAG